MRNKEEINLATWHSGCLDKHQIEQLNAQYDLGLLTENLKKLDLLQVTSPSDDDRWNVFCKKAGTLKNSRSQVLLVQ
ncbi:MAG: hypothetical protein IPL08_06495 [Saprospiraceae bacterium]|nr:hypothetical protein [Saprospiraceae bacterium]